MGELMVKTEWLMEILYMCAREDEALSASK
jgi:hypothetical protein